MGIDYLLDRNNSYIGITRWCQKHLPKVLFRAVFNADVDVYTGYYLEHYLMLVSMYVAQYLGQCLMPVLRFDAINYNKPG